MKYTGDVFDWDVATPYGKVTKAKKRVKKALGIRAALKPFRWWTNTKRRTKRKVGYESEAGRLIRNGPPTPGRCLKSQYQMIRRANPQAEVFVWSDMLDPNHNARANYYLVEGDYRGSWKHVPKDLRILDGFHNLQRRRSAVDEFGHLLVGRHAVQERLILHMDHHAVRPVLQPRVARKTTCPLTVLPRAPSMSAGSGADGNGESRMIFVSPSTPHRFASCALAASVLTAKTKKTTNQFSHLSAIFPSARP